MKKTSASVCVYIWGLEQVVDAMGAVFGLIIVYGRRISPDFQHELMRTLFKKAISTDKYTGSPHQFNVLSTHTCTRIQVADCDSSRRILDQHKSSDVRPPCRRFACSQEEKDCTCQHHHLPTN